MTALAPPRSAACPPARLPACLPTIDTAAQFLTTPHTPTLCHSRSHSFIAFNHYPCPHSVSPPIPFPATAHTTPHQVLKPGNKYNHAPAPHTHRRARANAVRNSTEWEIDETTKNKKRKTKNKPEKRKKKKEKRKKGKRKKKKEKGKRKKKKGKGKKHTYIHSSWTSLAQPDQTCPDQPCRLSLGLCQLAPRLAG